jgi:rhodanese-related sulfurtransferase
VKTISVQELFALSQQRPVELVDVRTLEEYRDVRAWIARHVPMDAIDPHELMQSRTLSTDEPMYFICEMGGRSGRTCLALMAAGYPNVVNVLGGTEAWVEAGFPAEHGDNTKPPRQR